MSPRGWDVIETAIFVIFFLLVVLLASSCSPQRTLPPGMPYPTVIRRGLVNAHVMNMDRLRCLGTGLCRAIR